MDNLALDIFGDGKPKLFGLFRDHGSYLICSRVAEVSIVKRSPSELSR